MRGRRCCPTRGLTARLLEELGRPPAAAIVASLDALHRGGDAEPAPYAERVDAADMQTAALFSGAAELGVAIAAVLIVAESATGDQADDDRIEAAAKRGGTAAADTLQD